MSVKLTKHEGSKIELEFKIEKEKWNLAVDEAFKRNAGKFKVPGFRNGKVPRNVIEKMYGESIMYDDAFNLIAEREYALAIKENDLHVVASPKVDISSIGKDKELVFTITTYVKPENVEVVKYKGLEVKKVDINVSKDDIENELKNIQNKNARMVSKDDGKIEEGDIATIDFEGFLDGVPFDGSKAEKYDLEIGSKSFIPGFEDQLIGMTKDESKDINVTFPSDYGAENLASKSVVFKIKLHEIKKKELPELNDEFAKDISEFETLKEYKESLKEKLLKDKQAKAKQELEQKVIEKLVDNTKVEIPEPMIEHQIEHLMEDFSQRLSYQGYDMKKYATATNQTEEELKKSFREPAIRDIKLDLAIEYILNKEEVQVSDDEIKTKIEELVKQYGNNDNADYANNDNIKEYIKNSIRHEKVFELLTSTAIQK